MIVYHVDDALHAPVMDGVHQMAQILHRSHIRIDGTVVTDRVGTAHRPLTAFFPDGMNGHQPEDIRPQPF